MTNRKFAVDPITGFINRDGSLPLARRVMGAATAKGQGLTMLWLDLDRFHKVNASFGHRGGDRIIAHVANRIRQRVPEAAHCLRMGSDEFAILLPGQALDDARGVGLRLAASLEQPLELDGMMIHPTASIRLAQHAAGEPLQAFFERADLAMLDAKRQGGNRLVVSGSEAFRGRHGVQLAREELAVESDLHLALETGGLSLDFQPVLGFDGRIDAVEGLMRFRVDGRQLAPGRFIPVAEKTGLIVRLGEWSLLQGTRFAARLCQEGRPTKVAINVSRAQLTSPGFLPALHGALICANVEPALIELELTESLVMDESDVIQHNLRRARATGVGLAIDDFGTGYSSLSCLKDLPATKLKLDRSFVQVLPDDRRAYAVVRAMSRLARELGMAMVAEGVETPAQLTALRDAEVDAIQGFIWARPMNEEALLAWLAQRNTQ